MINPETLLLGTDCFISPQYAENNNFFATLIDYKGTKEQRLYIFVDGNGDCWDCSIDEIDEVLE